jgi:hypothetical protein
LRNPSRRNVFTVQIEFPGVFGNGTNHDSANTDGVTRLSYVARPIAMRNTFLQSNCPRHEPETRAITLMS